jgi:hypothetical protein
MKLNHRRLATLARFLRRNNEKIKEHFHLEDWAGSNEFPFKVGALKLINCGTVGCAVGFGTLIPSFKKAGLHLEKSADWSDRAAIVFDGHRGWRAVEEFFGLDDGDSLHLFSASRYPTGAGPLDVAERIESFLNQHQE